MTKNENTKNVTLRVYSVVNQDPSLSKSDILKKLNEKLNKNSTKAKDRSMILNPDDPNKEEDMLSFFTLSSSKMKGSIIRFFYSEDTGIIPDALFDSEQIQISDIEKLETDQKRLLKDNYYFILNDSYLITALCGTSCKKFQTYINWLLEDVREEKLYEFTPKFNKSVGTQISQIKNIVIRDSTIDITKPADEVDIIPKKAIFKFDFDKVKELFNDTDSFEVIKKRNIMTATLSLQFGRKPKDMKKEDYEKVLSTFIKPIEDTNHITFITKNNGKISGNDVLLIKKVNVSLTDSKHIVESELFQEMEKILIDLKNEAV